MREKKKQKAASDVSSFVPKRNIPPAGDYYSYEICKLFERKYTNNLQIK